MVAKPVVQKPVTPVTPVKKKKPVHPKRGTPLGRPDLLTPELQEAMVKQLRLGAYAQDAANEVDISIATFHFWMNRGRKERERQKMLPDAEPKPAETKYLNFLEAIEVARGKGTIVLHNIILRGATSGDWRAAAYILERTRPDQYGNKEKIEHSGSVDSKVSIEMGDLEDKVLQILETRKIRDGAGEDVTVSPR